MVKINFSKSMILSILLGCYLFFVPLDFLTGRHLNGIGLSTIISLIIILIGFYNIIKKRLIYMSVDIIILLLILIIGLPPVLFSSTNIPTNMLITFSYYILIVIAFQNIIKTNDIDPVFLFKFTVYGVLCMSMYLLINGTIGYGGARLTTVERDLNPNVASGYILVGLGSVLYLLKKHQYALIQIGIASFMLITLILLQSKTAIISLLITIIFIMLSLLKYVITRKRIIIRYKDLNKIILLLISLLIAVAFVFIFVQNYYEINILEISRLDDVFTGNMDTITTGRSVIWENAFQESNVFFGTGFLTFRNVFNIPAHNLFVSVLTEVGVIGFVLLIGYFLCYLYQVYVIYNCNKHMGLVLLYFISTMIIFGMGNDIMEYKFYWVTIIQMHVIFISNKRYLTNKKIAKEE